MRQAEAYRLMGNRVHVTHQLVRVDDEEDDSMRRWVTEECEPFDGWVVKVTWRCDGTYSPRYLGSDEHGDCEIPAYLSETKRTWCIEVRSTPGGKPIPVPVGGFTE